MHLWTLTFWVHHHGNFWCSSNAVVTYPGQDTESWAHFLSECSAGQSFVCFRATPENWTYTGKFMGMCDP